MNSLRAPAAYPPSVGELIDRADVLARDLLYEAPHRDGRAMLRAWGEVVEGAHDLWHQLPGHSDKPGTGQDVISQLERSARTLCRSAAGGAEVDPMLQDIAGAFTRAAQLIARSGVPARADSERWSDAHLSDAFAARVKVMHTLYVAAHAVSVGLTQNVLAEKFDTRATGRSLPAEELRLRMVDVEQVAYSYIQVHYPQALDGRHTEPVDETRIPTAIAALDIHAQRVLVREPTTHALARVAGAAFAASTHAHRLWRAAAQAGHVDPRTFDHEIAPALETMIEKWDGAHTLLRRLTHRLDSSPAALSEACWALPDAMRDASRGSMGCPGQRQGQSVDLAATVRSLHRFHATVAGVASVLHEVARNGPLLVDARGANDLIVTGIDQDGRWAPPDPCAMVTPRDLLHKRAIPAPGAVRVHMEDASHDAAAASRAALRATLTASDRTPQAASPADRSTRLAPATGRLQVGQRLEQQHVGTATEIVRLRR